MKFSDVYRSEYFRAADLNGQQVKAVIERVEWKELDDEKKAVVYFQGHTRGLVLNRTNGKTIVRSYGDEVNQWAGKSIILFPTVVEFQAEPRDAIRIRIPEPDVNKPLPASPAQDDAAAALDAIPF